MRIKGRSREKAAHKRKLTVIIGLILILVGAIALLSLLKNKDDSGPKNTKSDNSKKVRFIAVGDMLPHDTVNLRAKTSSGYDYQPFFTKVKSYFNQADIRFCNQEVPSAGESLEISGYPTFNAPKEFAQDLSGLGCNLINLATNHANDKHQQGIDETRAVWDKLPTLAVAGTNRTQDEQLKVSHFSTGGISFAFLSYSQVSNDNNLTPFGLNKFDENLMKKQLREARSNADVVIVSAHWGTEYSPAVDSQQQKWAQFFAEQNVDIVIGTGPHVIEPVEWLGGVGNHKTLVWYSIGNFLSTQEEVEALIGGFAIMDIEKVNESFSITPSFMPTYMHYEWTSQQKIQGDLLARTNLQIIPLDRATEADFKSSQLSSSPENERSRITGILNQRSSVRIITSTQY